MVWSKSGTASGNAQNPCLFRICACFFPKTWTDVPIYLIISLFMKFICSSQPNLQDWVVPLQRPPTKQGRSCTWDLDRTEVWNGLTLSALQRGLQRAQKFLHLQRRNKYCQSHQVFFSRNRQQVYLPLLCFMLYCNLRKQGKRSSGSAVPLPVHQEHSLTWYL